MIIIIAGARAAPSIGRSVWTVQRRIACDASGYGTSERAGWRADLLALARQ
jgi:hypothetical protein